MANAVFLALLLVPFLMSGINMMLGKRMGLRPGETLAFSAGGLVISAAIISASFFGGKASKTIDEEVWNGRIVSKQRVHDDYQESYQCRCRTDSKGQQSCDTCYRTHYTVKWSADSTIGRFTIKTLDETDDDVYRSPDPAFYKTIRIGEACVKTHNYTNYIKAVPQSLFHFEVKEIEKQFAGQVPQYPIELHSRWKIDRVLQVGMTVPHLNEWNAKLADSLKDLGALKQVNAVIVLTNIADQNYGYALQSAWLNGKKNDVILIIGAPEFPNKAAWVRVLSFAKDEIFTVHLEDSVRTLEQLTPDLVIRSLTDSINEYYHRKPMAEFAYLDEENYPPNWLLAVTILFVIAAYVAFWIFMMKKSTGHKNQRYPF